MIIIGTVLALTLSACGGSDVSAPTPAEGPPLALLPDEMDVDGASSALVGPVKGAELRKGIERYRLVKSRTRSPYEVAGVDLNVNGRMEALVLFSGGDWCTVTGCSLVVFRHGRTGYRPISHITRVRAPIFVGPNSSFGWRDLIVRTGGGGAAIRTVRLGFNGAGYPKNALLQPEPTQALLSQSQRVITKGLTTRAASVR